MLKRGGPGAELLAPDRLEAIFSPLAGFGSLALAVSGGPDSLALMAMAARWRQAQRATPGIVVMSVDHGLRAEAAEEVARVCGYAAEAGFECVALKWEGAKPAAGLQAAARRARYRMMGEAMDARDIEVLVTAHHMDDQAETIVMRLAHGSGPAGLAGMAPLAEVEGVRVARPLLGLGRADLRGVVAETGWTAADDPSNADLTQERARWRAEMPRLEALGLTAGRLAKLGERLADAEGALAAAALAAYEQSVETDAFACFRLDRAALGRLPKAIAVRLLGRVLAAAGGDARAPELAQIEALAAALGTGDVTAATLGGCVVRGGAGSVEVCREAGRLAARPIELAPGAETVWDRRFKIASTADAPPVQIAAATEMTRGRLEKLAGRSMDGAWMEAVRAAPAVTDGARVMALGALVVDERVAVAVSVGPPGQANH